jgi:hypothetical protein
MSHCQRVRRSKDDHNDGQINGEIERKENPPPPEENPHMTLEQIFRRIMK